jgi:metallo-beta-lactamase class B
VLISSAGDRATLERGRSIDRDDLDAFEPVRVDRTVRDGETVVLGGVRLVARLTPGHTPGCISWTTTTRDPRIAGGRPLSVIFACSLTPAGLKLVRNPRYPEAVANFRATFARLATTKADVFLTFHPEFFSMTEKRRRQVAGDAAAFVDPGELPRRLATARAGFEAELVRQSTEAGGRTAQ